MILFGLMYFTVLTETCMFDIIINWFLNLTNGKINVYTIMAMTTVIAGIGVFANTGMIEGLSSLVVAICPSFMTRYLHLILLALSVIVLRFVPYQFYTSISPLLIAIGASFGLSAIVVMAPFVTIFGLATGSSPMTSATYVGTGLLDIDTEEYCNLAVPVQTATTIVVIVIVVGMIFGVIP